MADVDIISDILSATIAAYPDSGFIQGLSHQYLVKGGLSRKQMEGLYQKAVKLSAIPAARLATLEAMILKKPKRFKSALPPIEPLYVKDPQAGKLIDEILVKYPQHKRVIFFRIKYERNETLSSGDMIELEKFHKLLVGKANSQ